MSHPIDHNDLAIDPRVETETSKQLLRGLERQVLFLFDQPPPEIRQPTVSEGDVTRPFENRDTRVSVKAAKTRRRRHPSRDTTHNHHTQSPRVFHGISNHAATLESKCSSPVPSKSQRVPFLATGSLRCSWRPGGLAAGGLNIPQHERRRVALSKHSIQSKIADRSSSSADPKLLVENLESQCAEEALSDRILERVTGGRRFYDASDMRTWEGSDDVRSPNTLRGALVDATLDPSCALRCGAVELWRHDASCVPTTCGTQTRPIRRSGPRGIPAA